MIPVNKAILRSYFQDFLRTNAHSSSSSVKLRKVSSGAVAPPGLLPGSVCVEAEIDGVPFAVYGNSTESCVLGVYNIFEHNATGAIAMSECRRKRKAKCKAPAKRKASGKKKAKKSRKKK